MTATSIALALVPATAIFATLLIRNEGRVLATVRDYTTIALVAALVSHSVSIALA